LIALLDDGTVALLSPPAPSVSGLVSPRVIHQVRLPTAAAAEAIACSVDGELFAVASSTSLCFFVVVGGDDAPGGATGDNGAALPMRAYLRGQTALDSCRPVGLDVASLGGGRGVAAVGDSSGLTLLCSATDAGQDSRVHLHLGCALCACRFSNDGSLLALAALDGRLFVRQRDAVNGWARAPSLAWCARVPCEHVLTLDFSSETAGSSELENGRWLLVCGWKGDVAVYDCACFEGPCTERRISTDEDAGRLPAGHAEAAVAVAAAAGESAAAAAGAAPAVCSGAQGGEGGGVFAVSRSTAAVTTAATAVMVTMWQDWRLSRYWPAEAEVAADKGFVGPCAACWCRAPHAVHWLCRADAVLPNSGGEQEVAALAAEVAESAAAEAAEAESAEAEAEMAVNVGETCAALAHTPRAARRVALSGEYVLPTGCDEAAAVATAAAAAATAAAVTATHEEASVVLAADTHGEGVAGTVSVDLDLVAVCTLQSPPPKTRRARSLQNAPEASLALSDHARDEGGSRRLVLLHLHGGGGGGEGGEGGGNSAGEGGVGKGDVGVGGPCPATLAVPLTAGARLRGLCTGPVRLAGAVASNAAEGPCADVEVVVWVDGSGELGCRVLWPWERASAEVSSRADAPARQAQAAAAPPSSLASGGMAGWRTPHGVMSLLPSTDADGAELPSLLIIQPTAGCRRPSRRLMLPAIAADLLQACPTSGPLQVCRSSPAASPPASSTAATSPLTFPACATLGVRHVAVAGSGVVQTCCWAEAADATTEAKEARESQVAASCWHTHVLGQDWDIGGACMLDTLLLLLLLPSTAASKGGRPVTEGADGGCLMGLDADSHRSTALRLPTNLTAERPPELLPEASSSAADSDEALGTRFLLLVWAAAQPQAWLGEILSCGTPKLVSEMPLRVVMAPVVRVQQLSGFRMLGETIVELL